MYGFTMEIRVHVHVFSELGEALYLGFLPQLLELIVKDCDAAGR